MRNRITFKHELGLLSQTYPLRGSTLNNRYAVMMQV